MCSKMMRLRNIPENLIPFRYYNNKGSETGTQIIENGSRKHLQIIFDWQEIGQQFDINNEEWYLLVVYATDHKGDLHQHRLSGDYCDNDISIQQINRNKSHFDLNLRLVKTKRDEFEATKSKKIQALKMNRVYDYYQSQFTYTDGHDASVIYLKFDLFVVQSDGTSFLENVSISHLISDKKSKSPEIERLKIICTMDNAYKGIIVVKNFHFDIKKKERYQLQIFFSEGQSSKKLMSKLLKLKPKTNSATFSLEAPIPRSKGVLISLDNAPISSYYELKQKHVMGLELIKFEQNVVPGCVSNVDYKKEDSFSSFVVPDEFPNKLFEEPCDQLLGDSGLVSDELLNNLDLPSIHAEQLFSWDIKNEFDLFNLLPVDQL